MYKLCVQDATIVFSPAAGWNWESWNGKTSLSPENRSLLSEGRPFVLPADIEKLALELIGKSYEASGFDDIPGVVVSAQVLVTESTLSIASTCVGKRPATEQTTGTFQISCVPSFKSGSPPIPDAAPAKQGKWRFDSSGQSLAIAR